MLTSLSRVRSASGSLTRAAQNIGGGGQIIIFFSMVTPAKVSSFRA